MRKRVIVCGAGLAGLNAARNLIALGFDVQVLEKSDRAGGRIATDQIDGYTLDRGFQVVNPAYSELKRTGAISEIEFVSIPKGVDLRLGSETYRIGDFRQNLGYLRDSLRSETGKFSEKLSFLKYLIQRPSDVAFGEAATEFADFFDISLKPFLDGVFLTDSNLVSNRVARDLLGWFIKGRPALVRGGISQLAETLSRGVSIRFELEVEKVTSRKVHTSSGDLDADAVIVALDPVTSAKLLDLPTPEMSHCSTWYFKIDRNEIASNHLRVGGIGPIKNSLVLTNLLPDSAPMDSGLVQATTLATGSESEVRNHLSYLWDRSVSDWQLIHRYEIANALPFHAPGQPLTQSARLPSEVFVAGDWRNVPSQQGALLSGRLAARAVTALLSER